MGLSTKKKTISTKKWYIYDALKNRVVMEHPFETEEECQESIDHSVSRFKTQIVAQEDVGSVHTARKMKKELPTIMKCRPIRR